MYTAPETSPYDALPANALTKDDFPEPLAPIIAVNFAPLNFADTFDKTILPQALRCKHRFLNSISRGMISVSVVIVVALLAVKVIPEEEETGVDGKCNKGGGEEEAGKAM
jgi:hypothetical protein